MGGREAGGAALRGALKGPLKQTIKDLPDGQVKDQVMSRLKTFAEEEAQLAVGTASVIGGTYTKSNRIVSEQQEERLADEQSEGTGFTELFQTAIHEQQNKEAATLFWQNVALAIYLIVFAICMYGVYAVWNVHSLEKKKEQTKGSESTVK